MCLVTELQNTEAKSNKIKGEIGNCTIPVRYFNIPLSKWYETKKKKTREKKKTVDSNDLKNATKTPGSKWYLQNSTPHNCRTLTFFQVWKVYLSR